MGLRAKTIFILIAVIIPITAAFTFYRLGAGSREATQRRIERIAMKQPPRLLRRCQRRANIFIIQRPHVTIWAYDSNYLSKNPNAPTFPKELRSIEEDPASVTFWFRGKTLGYTKRQLEGNGACSILLFEWKRPPFSNRLLRDVAFQVGMMLLVLLILGFLLSAPLVHRIRKLQAAITKNDGANFDTQRYNKPDELDELARAFGNVLHRLEIRENDLKEYVANTTHDLATPITVLQHRLRRLGECPLGEEAKELVRTTLEESHYIASLIANMSAVARLENTLTLSTINLNELVERIVTRHRPIAEGKHIELDFALPLEVCEIEGDETLLEQAVSNFVQNAIQYNVEGGHVGVILEYNESPSSPSFILSILDDGPGVNPSLLSQLTTRSIRSDDARNRNPGGKGFGLSIAAEVAKKHGWHLTFENLEPGFRVILKK